ncbi:MAG TPA: hypothetical protein VGR37_08730 [Longimicrobiaceae bacterium]|nr:hypothetical protein [Longimicrobiaceae bacterium]
MKDLFGFPYFEVEFDKKGKVVDRAAADGVLRHVRSEGTTDLFVLSHGWNNDIAEARDLYSRLVKRLRFVLDFAAPDGVVGRKYAVLGVFWPSKKFADKDLIPGGAASLGPVGDSALKVELRNLRGAFDVRGADTKLKRAEELVDRLDSPDAQKEYVQLMRELLPRDEGSAEKRDEVPPAFYERAPSTLLRDLAKPERPLPGGRGGAAGLGNVFDRVKVGARNLLNFVTYYQMKERAGLVGSTGVSQLLRDIRVAAPQIRLHLAGHSFGGRLVTAAANAADQGAVATLTLLQAAFSHHGFSTDYDHKGSRGLFCDVITAKKVKGPVLITHTANDRAVGLAYPLASRIAGQQAAALGDKDDPFGGIGRNGAQKSNAVEKFRLSPLKTRYEFEGGSLYNLLADDFVSDHSDVTDEEVAYAILSAVATT